MHTTNRQRLRELISGLPRWRDARTRGTLFADLAWDLAAQDPEPVSAEPAAAADQLIALALAAVDGPGVSGLLEDLRELGAGGPVGVRALDEIEAELADGPGGANHRPRWEVEPFPGLLSLEAWQAPIFFGRRAETRDLLRRLTAPTGPRLTLVSGVLGCGKTSLVQAGVRARLAAGGLPRVPQAAHWLVSVMVPADNGYDPFLALTHGLAGAAGVHALDPPTEAAAIKGHGAPALADLLERCLAGRPADACWLIVIDQFEELFTTVDGELAGEFFETLIGALELPRLRVLATLRADLIHRCCARPDLTRVINGGGLYCLATPERPSLERMILGPLARLDLTAPLTIEARLVQRILDDAAGAPGGLALMAEALKELCEQGRPRGHLTLEVYEEQRLDGLQGVIARRAERALERAGAAAQGALHGLFAQLLTVTEDGTATRRRGEWQRLAANPPTAAVIEALATDDTRLVQIGEGERATVEFVHEVLLHEWPALHHWIAHRRDALRTRAQVDVEARTWAALGYPPDLRWRHEALNPARVLLAETGLLDGLEQNLDLAAFLTPESEWLLSDLLCSRVEPVQREEIGLRLAQIGDPREGVGVTADLPCPRWCRVPAGEVLIEGHGCLPVAPFRIAAYPVTHCQFQAFLNAADGFAAPRWWEDLRQSPPVSGAMRRHGNYPATHVCWFEATAFCRWLSVRLGYEVRLPDEWEWQWAAQSARPGFFYPWGRDWREGHANTDEGAVGRATAVGMYPYGRSAQGVYDLAGNTWEWCRNRFDKPKIVTADPDRSRVLRGGSWRVNQGFSRADFRLDGLPEDRMGGSSFRLVTGDDEAETD
ncbi:MAG TPA: SUMF1/EgtB/PvdO family nonheme iron enzyme [Lamprocystis sp. (in: g-proteobacteria)]|nr:SUMF1/EgtB/PvdO family nonheme iron enzyme [Lamprocystis sp. (in: g-proteobacteria)]